MAVSAVQVAARHIWCDRAATRVEATAARAIYCRRVWRVAAAICEGRRRVRTVSSDV